MSLSGWRTGAVLVCCLALTVGGLHGTGVAAAQTTGATLAVGSTPGEDPGRLTGQAGDEVTVRVWVNASDVRGYQANLSFDPSVVQVRSISGTDDFATPVSRVDNTAGVVEFNQLRDTGVENPVLARVTFELTGPVGSETTLGFAEDDTRLSDSDATEINLTQYDGVTVAVESSEPALTYTPSSPKIGTEVQFTATVDDPNIEEYRWDFGDGTSGAGQQANHTYFESGTYTVTLTTEDGAGNINEYTTELTVERAFADVVRIDPGERVNVPERERIDRPKLEVYGIEVDKGQSVAVIGRGENTLRLYSPDVDILDQMTLPTADSTLVGTTAAQSGTYYVAIRRSYAITYLSVELTDPDPFEPNQDRTTAERIDLNSRLTGTLNETDSEDWFAVEAGPGDVNATARLTLSAVNQRNIAVEMYDAEGNQVGELDSFESETKANGLSAIYTAEQRVVVSDPGTYYVRVRALEYDRADSDDPSVYRLWVNGTEPTDRPVRIDVSSSTAQIGTEVEFSVQNDSNIESYKWDFGDGRSASGEAVEHVYLEPGTYTVTLTAIDSEGDVVDENTTSVTVEPEFDNVDQLEPGETVNVPATDDLKNRSVVVYGIDVEKGQAIAAIGQGLAQELLLYSPTARVLDRMGLGPDSTLVGTTAEQTGTYYVVVTRSGSLSSFVSAELHDPDPFEPNQDRSTAERIDLNSRIDGTVNESDSDDWFVVNAGSGSLNVTAELTLPAVNQGDIGVEIYDAEGNQIGELGTFESETKANGLSAIYTAEQQVTVSDPGTYYVRVRALEDTRPDSDDPRNYELWVNGTESTNQLSPLCTGCGEPADLDGDGKYEDVNGNGVQGFGDVVTLFDNLQSEPITENTELYDYNDNGVVGFGDVIRLFETI
jgi:PKD repeat protein